MKERTMLSVILVTTICTATPEAAEVLMLAHQQAAAIKTLQFQFQVNRYTTEPLAFWADGVMTRCDCHLPGKQADGRVVFGSRRYAFDGKSHQMWSGDKHYFVHSQLPMHPESGPCWTPLEECYRWLRLAEIDFRWQSISNPDVWSRLTPETEVIEVEHDGSPCLRLSFPAPREGLLHVYFSKIHGYFPVRHEFFRGSEVKFQLLASETTNSGTEDAPLWLPAKVQYWQVAHGAIAERNLTYTVLPGSLVVNQPIDHNIFKLEPIDCEVIIDRDLNQEYQPGRTVQVPMPTNPTTPISGRWELVSSPLLWLFVANLALAAFAVTGTMRWRFRR
jgi:hypothetical protein